MVESATGEGADHGCHPVLNIQKVWLVACVQKALKQGPIEKSDVAISAHAGGWQLIWVSDQQHLLHSCLESDEKVGLGGLCSLVDDEACDLSPQLFQFLIA